MHIIHVGKIAIWTVLTAQNERIPSGSRPPLDRSPFSDVATSLTGQCIGSPDALQVVFG
jgi:hypothetical protein